MARHDPGDAIRQRELYISLENVSRVQELQGDAKASLQTADAMLAVAARIAAGDADDTGKLRDLAAAYRRVATLTLLLGERTGQVIGRPIEWAGGCHHAAAGIAG